MKFIKYSLITLLSSILLIGCNEDKFLTQSNVNALTPETFWKTSEHFDYALNTVYAALQFNTVSGFRTSNEMALSDLSKSDTWYATYTTYKLFNFTNSDPLVQNKWSELYIGINRANQIATFIKNEDIDMLPEEKLVVEAQARTLRAFYYFELANSYNGAVINTTYYANSDSLNKKLNTRAEVISQVVIPDLEFAAEHLPTSWSNMEAGRVTWGAAVSLLGKAYLYDGKWAEAAAEFKKVIDSGVYSLSTDYVDNFTEEGEHNSESIFEVNYSTSVLPPSANRDWVDNIAGGNVTPSEASSLEHSFTHILTAGGFNVVTPSQFLHETLLSDEINPDHPANEAGETHSQRLTSSILVPRFYGAYFNRVWEEDNGDMYPMGGGHSGYVKKFTRWNTGISVLENNGQTSPINFRLIRYADVLLMYAEALNEQGNFTDAMTYIDMVRERAGVYTLQHYVNTNGGTFPKLNISQEVTGAPHPQIAPSQESIREHIRYVERPVELSFEGHRWDDLRRWDIVGEALDRRAADEQWRLDNAQTILGQPPLYIGAYIIQNFVEQANKYNPEVHKFFPIPANEVQTNPDLYE
ncbi:RagB/SusD family nutrient uptake outer membrane protein [Flammeovirga sp. EKP202]|uniref:RagB/SusD family nutrient uptake outer membrane protein n=1 Tax=Flammeovirga sp. EKP202 TaxID=2770592 RepID=UPI00165F093B|nr:RagB/SusD family nutrient uptake outer membrane protein [Flammeovirga sp. EKP202]MBD0404383.1 RagB/SusD family nutrient uptake outer membrane protein [Flammeovirga sp. EKP202]